MKGSENIIELLESAAAKSTTRKTASRHLKTFDFPNLAVINP